MIESDQVPQSEQCKYCQKSINTSHCTEHKAHIEKDSSFWCPFYHFDDYMFSREAKNKHNYGRSDNL